MLHPFPQFIYPVLFSYTSSHERAPGSDVRLLPRNLFRPLLIGRYCKDVLNNNPAKTLKQSCWVSVVKSTRIRHIGWTWNRALIFGLFG